MCRRRPLMFLSLSPSLPCIPFPTYPTHPLPSSLSRKINISLGEDLKQKVHLRNLDIIPHRILQKSVIIWAACLGMLMRKWYVGLLLKDWKWQESIWRPLKWFIGEVIKLWAVPTHLLRFILSLYCHTLSFPRLCWILLLQHFHIILSLVVVLTLHCVLFVSFRLPFYYTL